MASIRDVPEKHSSKELDASLLSAFSSLSLSNADHELVSALVRISKASPKLIKSSTYQAPADPSIEIQSWKMNEFKYYDVPSPFPTLARGLFTQAVPTGKGGEVKHRIVARGYDKFFNIGEVPWTTVSGSRQDKWVTLTASVAAQA
jgi:tRNA ligase